MENLLFTLNTVLPVFIIIFIGVILKRINFINEDFISVASKLVFKIALPSLVFIKVSNANLKELAVFSELLYTVIYISIVFFLCFIFGLIFIKDKSRIGVFAQAVFRGNYGIIGLALLDNMLGDAGLSKGAVILAIASPLYNIYATIGLIVPHHKFSLEGIKKIIKRLLTNPIIIALILSFIVLIIEVFYPDFHLPEFMNTTINKFSSMALPVALICIGGSLSIAHIKENKFLVILTTMLRIVISPLLFTIIAVFFGFRNESLAALFMLFGVPSAIASFILAKTMSGDADLAANVIVTTTVGSVITLTVGIYLLKVFELI